MHTKFREQREEKGDRSEPTRQQLQVGDEDLVVVVAGEVADVEQQGIQEEEELQVIVDAGVGVEQQVR